MSSHQRGNHTIWHLGFWLGACFCVARMHMAVRFVTQCWVASAVGITNPFEGVQTRRRMVYPGASFLSQVAVGLVFCAQACTSGTVDHFSVSGLSWFPEPGDSHSLRKTMTEARQLTRCTDFYYVSKSPNLFRFQIHRLLSVLYSSLN